MNLKQSVQRRLRGHAGETDVNLTAVMNIFLILIPFLLLTATFVRLTVLELSLPNLDRSRQAVSTPPQNAIVNMLRIRDDGFLLESEDMSLPALPKTGQDYNWQALSEQLERVKQQHPESQDIIIAPENSILYESIISVMDRCRDAGFPNISISG